MAEQADRETLARVFNSGYGPVTDPDDTLPDHCRTMADWVLASDWLADHDRRVREEGAREALAEVQALADAGYQGAVMANLRYADGFYDGWNTFVVVLKDRLRAAALGTGEEPQVAVNLGEVNVGEITWVCENAVAVLGRIRQLWPIKSLTFTFNSVIVPVHAGDTTDDVWQRWRGLLAAARRDC